MYDPKDWYWLVGEGVEPYSSAAGDYVPAQDPTYLAWLADGAVATRIATEAELGEVLQLAGVFVDNLPGNRRLVPKSVVQARLEAMGGLAAAVTFLLDNDRSAFARWVAPDHPSVYADDEGLLLVLGMIGCTTQEIAAITAPA